MRITRDKFLAATGNEPQDDDLERVNCPLAGQFGHWCCGWDKKLDKPQFYVGPRIADDPYKAHWFYKRFYDDRGVYDPALCAIAVAVIMTAFLLFVSRCIGL